LLKCALNFDGIKRHRRQKPRRRGRKQTREERTHACHSNALSPSHPPALFSFYTLHLLLQPHEGALVLYVLPQLHHCAPGLAVAGGVLRCAIAALSGVDLELQRSARLEGDAAYASTCENIHAYTYTHIYAPQNDGEYVSKRSITVSMAEERSY